jgi:(1->4)-alpha-D-glucan 1-alpha-D-glucosylmutase
VHTSWLSPDETYESAVLRFAELALESGRRNPFLQSFLPFQARVAELGIYNSLSQLLIKITAPGIPDFYQGSELWDLSLVDPDNRRPVDYDIRARMLADLQAQLTSPSNGRSLADLLDKRAAGRVKLFAITNALAARGRLRDVFERGDYFPLQTSGPRRDCVFGFARHYQGRIALTCVPRLIASIVPDGTAPPIGRSIWNETTLALPPDMAATVRRQSQQGALPVRFRDVFTDATVEAHESDGRLIIPAASVFENFPIALLVSA